MKLRLLLILILMLEGTSLAWADPSNTLVIKEKDKAPGYIFFFNKIYNKKAPNGYILVPRIMASNQWNEAHPFPTPVFSPPYEVKITDSGISIGKSLEKWPNKIESGKCIWYVHENGTFKYLGKSPIHYVPQDSPPADYYCEPIKG